MTKTTRTRRLVVNGMRVVEGENRDWYEKDGKIVIECLPSLRQRDLVLMEYPDFAEEEIDHANIRILCKGCSTLVTPPGGYCLECKKRDIRQRIDELESRIQFLERNTAEEIDGLRRSIKSETDALSKLGNQES